MNRPNISRVGVSSAIDSNFDFRFHARPRDERVVENERLVIDDTSQSVFSLCSDNNIFSESLVNHSLSFKGSHASAEKTAATFRLFVELGKLGEIRNRVKIDACSRQHLLCLRHFSLKVARLLFEVICFAGNQIVLILLLTAADAVTLFPFRALVNDHIIA